ncbi:MAG: hypothetical protein JWM18_4306 [Chloroflexi bacterium]|jgi:hypothetical protein|nr:hypothetical protein [Chloroflexota bacterium]
MLPNMRPMTWLVVAFNTLLAVSIVAGAPGGGPAFFLGNGVLAVIWVASNPRKQSCPVCRSAVPRAFLVCSVCRYDFYRPLPQRRPRGTGHS